MSNGSGKIIAIAESVLGKIAPSTIQNEVDEWLGEHITNPNSPPLDRSLSSSSSAAPADMVGDLNRAFGLYPAFEMGNIRPSTGEKQATNTRIRTGVQLPTSTISKIETVGGFTFYVYLYARDGSYVSCDEIWINSLQVSELPESVGFISLVFRKASEEGSDLSAYLSEMETYVTITKLQKTVNENIERLDEAIENSAALTQNLLGVNAVFEMGNIRTDTGELQTTNIRIRTKNKLPIALIGRIASTGGFTFYVYLYDKAGEYLSCDAVWKNDFSVKDVPNNVGYVNIVLRKASEEGTDLSAYLSTVDEYVTFYNTTAYASGIYQLGVTTAENTQNIATAQNDILALSEQQKVYASKYSTDFDKKTRFDYAKYSSLNFSDVITYNSSEAWTGGTDETIDGSTYKCLTSTGNRVGILTRKNTAFLHYLRFAVIVEGAENIETLSITLYPVAGNPVNKATFNLSVVDGINYIILNRVDSADATQWTQWGNINTVELVLKAETNTQATVKFSPIATYDRKAMCTISFDDGHITHYNNAFLYMNAKTPPLHGDIAIITDNIGVGNHLTRVQLETLISAGWDISSHTRNHIHLSELSKEEQAFQLSKAKEYLCGIHSGEASNYLTPPFGSQPDLDVLKKYCTVRRYAVNKYNNQPILDPLELNTLSVGVDTPYDTVKGWIDYAIANQLWVVITWHMLLDSGIDYSWPIQYFHDIVDYLISQSDVIDTVSITEGLYKQ